MRCFDRRSRCASTVRARSSSVSWGHTFATASSITRAPNPLAESFNRMAAEA